MLSRAHRRLVQLFSGLLLLATIPWGLGSLGADRAEAQTCGGRGQPTCTRDKLLWPCWENDVCFVLEEYCDEGLRTGSGHNCEVIAGQPIPVPAQVSFRDGNNEVNAGYVVTVDLRQLQEIVPNGSHPRICTRGELDLRPVNRNPQPGLAEPWVEQPDYGPRLAVNGSFFRLDTGDPWEQMCTNPMGYTVSSGGLVRGEERIVAYNIGAPPERYDPGTLLFYAHDRPEGRAEIKWYPFMGSQPNSVPPGINNAISGIPLIRDGIAVARTGPEAASSHPRTAVGLRADNNQLVIVTVNAGTDNGTSLAALAAYMIGLGVRNAINLDGGGSAQLYYSSGGVTVRSLPSDLIPPRYRPVPNFLGFE